MTVVFEALAIALVSSVFGGCSDNVLGLRGSLTSAGEVACALDIFFISASVAVTGFSSFSVLFERRFDLDSSLTAMDL